MLTLCLVDFSQVARPARRDGSRARAPDGPNPVNVGTIASDVSGAPFLMIYLGHFLICNACADDNESPTPDSSSEENHGHHIPEQHRLDDIKTEYHPNSSRPSTISHFEDYRAYDRQGAKIPPVLQIIFPFRSRADFEFAELALEAALNRKQTERLISIINKCLCGKDAFTFKDQADLDSTWEHASLLGTPVALTSFKPAYPYLNMYPNL